MAQILAVNEIFGPTFQGEGPSTGRRAIFLRLSMCNLKCTWCDTKFTWDWDNYDRNKEIHLMTVASVRAQIDALDPDQTCILVISGGEPLLQKRNLLPLLLSEPREVEIETNGTISPFTASVGINYNVSPKLASSGNSATKAIDYDVLQEMVSAEARFKFVISNSQDLKEAQMVVDAVGIPKPQVWLMPEGKRAEDLLNDQDWVVERAQQLGWNFTTRLHVLLWGNTRGK